MGLSSVASELAGWHKVAYYWEHTLKIHGE